MTQAQEIQDTQEQLNWHWRNSMRVVRFFPLMRVRRCPFRFCSFMRGSRQLF